MSKTDAHWRWRRRRFMMASRKMCSRLLVYILFLRHTLQWLSFMFLMISEPLSHICLRICFSKTPVCTRTRLFRRGSLLPCHFLFSTDQKSPPPLKKGFKKWREEHFSALFSLMKCFLFLVNYLGRFHWRTPSGTRWDLHPDLFVIYPLYL